MDARPQAPEVRLESLNLMRMDGYPLSARWLVYDLVYAPAPTPLLAAARAAGARTLDGLGMLVHQAARSFALWTGLALPVELFWQAARRACAAMQSE